MARELSHMEPRICDRKRDPDDGIRRYELLAMDRDEVSLSEFLNSTKSSSPN